MNIDKFKEEFSTKWGTKTEAEQKKIKKITVIGVAVVAIVIVLIVVF